LVLLVWCSHFCGILCQLEEVILDEQRDVGKWDSWDQGFRDLM
jgi:hypothetical protein